MLRISKKSRVPSNRAPGTLAPSVCASACVLAVAAIGMIGCATVPPPTELSRARTQIEEADRSQARRYAPADLDRAHEELSEADAAYSHHEIDAARRYAESAEVDADVAVAQASAGEARRTADDLIRGNGQIRRASGGAPETLEEAIPDRSGSSMPPPNALPPGAPPPPPPADANEPPR